MFIKVKVVAGSKKEKIISKKDNRFEIFVKEPAERNLANTRVKEILASIYKVNIKTVRITSGHQSPSKIFSINLPENLV